MTETEYVEHIMNRAKAYIAEVLREPGERTKEAFDAWEGTKTALSAHTTVSLCEAWLDRAVEQQARDA